MLQSTYMSERIPYAYALFTPSLYASCFFIFTESPVQQVLVNGVYLLGMIMPDALTLSCRL